MLSKRVAIALNPDSNQTYRIRRYIYGLPDAGRAYYDAYSEHLLEHGFVITVSDPCLFTKISADHLEDIEHFKTMINKRFEITVNAEADHHLGVNIQRLEDASLELTELKLLTAILRNVRKLSKDCQVDQRYS